MPAVNDLAGSLIETGNYFQDAVDNTVQLVREHLDLLGVQLGSEFLPLLSEKVLNYDEIKVYHAPLLAVTFDSARQIEIKINNCSTLGIDLVLYYYLESLSYGNSTHPFMAPMWRLMEMFLIHKGLYGFTNGTAKGIEVTNCSLVGRRLDADVYLTCQVNLSVYKRTCLNDHS